MREIEFRAKNINNKWRYGYLERQDLLYDENYDCSSSIQIETLGQYTGLTDKNGTKIFEGDIVIADFDYKKEPMEVIYYKCGFKLKSRNCKEVYDYSIHDETPELEVIGNIYDNPELLEVE